ncbi:MAG: hypothetical protein DPW16_18660 [Chloroflexi bacterium]|nr:hypothetical protein [Chloroflexota bacterium]
MARMANEQFWVKVKALLDSDTPITQINAFCLYAYSEGVLAGERQRLKLQSETHQPLRDPEKLKQLMPMFGYDGKDDFYRFIVDRENWVDGKVIYQTPDQSELPVLYYFGDFDHLGRKLASLDMRQCLPDVLMPKLAKVMSLGLLSMNMVHSIWLYTIYLLEKINDPRVVPILTDFLEQKVDWKFETVTKGLMYRAALNVFLHYQTPEAMQAIKNRPQLEEILKEGVAEGYGWLLKKIP